MVHKLGEAVEIPQVNSRTKPKHPASLDKVRALLERGGFLASVAGDEEFARACEVVKRSHDENKGVLVFGKTGRGKTQFLKAIKSFNYDRECSWLYTKEEQHLKWMKDCKEFYLQRNVFLDDVGAETDFKAYGNTVDIVGDFIQLYHYRGIGRLYVSTNLDGEGLNARYDMRILSRLTELCVVYQMGGESKRKVIFYGEQVTKKSV
jgi:DNA replication protein DnaC